MNDALKILDILWNKNTPNDEVHFSLYILYIIEISSWIELLTL